ncbi:MAG: ZIP family metal transporter [Candidatus Bathyarchaeota archaeon]|nr:ZIP family metal transporter [Candidatus Bathyarchaeota archaeon]MDH5662894.1 ZIP family metal transporter [Candidatus Bathyarchaeota archaeon]
MTVVWLYSLVSVIIVSLISLVGVLVFSLKEENLKKILLYLVSFSAGGLFGHAFIHMIPEAVGENGFGLQVSLYILSGIITSFIVEKFLQWRHCHIPTSEEHPHSFAYMNLFGDAVHNFIDGLIIGGSYLASIPLGVATTLAVVFHEIPQEIGDFGVLVYGGFNKSRALFFNFSTALTAIFGAIVALSLGFFIQDFIPFLIPFAAGNFIYIAGSDLIPELRKEEPRFLKSALQLTAFVLGVLILFSLVLLE